MTVRPVEAYSDTRTFLDVKMARCCMRVVFVLFSVVPIVPTQLCRTVRVGGDGFQSLQLALESLLQLQYSNSSNNCTIIELAPGTHVISSQVLFTSEIKSLELVGTLDWDVYVECTYSVKTNYTWYFSGVTSVKMENINFHSCPRPLRIDSTDNIEIRNCTFRYFTEAVLDIFNCHHSLLVNVIFEHNRGSGISTVSFRGNTGGVSFGFNNLPQHFDSPYIRVSNCMFNNNTAAADSVFLTSSQAFARRVFTGRGGALAVFAFESRVSINVVIKETTFYANYARSFGGAVYILPGGRRNSHHNVLLQRCSFDFNQAGICGGGVQVTYPTPGLPYQPHLVTVIDCNVTNNSAPFNGGGMYISSITHGNGNSINIQGSMFQENSARYGGALVLKSFALTLDKSALSHHLVTDCMFNRNSGISGVVSVWFVSASFTGRNNFTHNTGNALQVISSVVHLSGEFHFVNNSGGDDSAIHLLSFSQAVFNDGLYINFEGNSGRFGAGIYVDNQYHSFIGYSRPAACFLRHEENYTPEQWENITLHFTENHAVLASNMYISRMDWHACSSPFLYASQYLKTKYNDIVNWPIWEFRGSVNTGYEEPTHSQWAVQTTVKKLTSPNTTVKAWPGHKFTFVMEGIEEYDNPTTTLARLRFTPYQETRDVNVRFIPEVIVIGPDPTTGLLSKQFTVFHEIDNTASTTIEGPLGEVALESLDITATDVESANFVLVGELCPSGYVLQVGSSESICLCNEDIPEILLCKDDQETIIIKNGKWAVYVPIKEEANMQFYVCPAGYCRCIYDTVISNDTCVYLYSHNDPDVQCTCGRKGTLCGECKNSEDGVSALLNKCVSCPEASGFLIVGLVVIDVVVIAFLTVVNIPLPSWSYPFIFYIQIAPIAGLYFPESFINVGKFLYFVGSASSFYFVYDFCLYGNMSSEVAYLLRFLPLCVAILTCTVILIGRSICFKSKRKIPNHGLWAVILLMYTHVVYTSLSVLYCPAIIESDGTIEHRWFVNGDVKCFTGGHAALAVLSILVFIVAVALIPVCFFLSLGHVHKLSHNLWLLIMPMTSPYKHHCKWWSAVELSKRLVILLFIVTLPGNEEVSVLLVALYTTVYIYVQPYKSKITNLIESGVNLNFLVLLILNTTAYFREDYLIFPSREQSVNSSNSCSDSVNGIATVSWILMPFFYLPLLVFCVTILIVLLAYVRRRCSTTTSAVGEEDQNELVVNGDNDSEVTTVEYTSWSVELSTDGFLNLKTQKHNASHIIKTS